MATNESVEELLPEAVSAPPWPLLARLPAQLAAHPGSREEYRQQLAQAHEELKTRFPEGCPRCRSAEVDLENP